MRERLLGVGDLGVSKEKSEYFATYGLGSCIAVVLFCPQSGALGMAHVALPESRINPRKGKEKPGYFADTAIPVLLESLRELAGDVPARSLQAKLVGGAQLRNTDDIFNIGAHNMRMIQKILEDYSIGIAAQEVGGNESRSVAAYPGKGRVVLSSPGMAKRYL